MVGAGFEDFGVQVEIEGVVRDQAGLPHGPELHGIQEHAAIAGRAHEDWGWRARWQVDSKPARDAVLLLLRGVVLAQQVAQLGAGHLALEFGPRQHAR